MALVDIRLALKNLDRRTQEFFVAEAFRETSLASSHAVGILSSLGNAPSVGLRALKELLLNRST